MENKIAVILRSGEGKKVEISGAELFFKSFKDNGSVGFTLCEYIAPAQYSGPPPHYHKIMVEGFYIMEGSLTMTVNQEMLTLEKGDYAYIPAGVTHTFANRTDSPVRMLMLISPPGLENYFFEFEALIKAEGGFPLKDMTKAFALMQKYDTHFPGH